MPRLSIAIFFQRSRSQGFYLKVNNEQKDFLYVFFFILGYSPRKRDNCGSMMLCLLVNGQFYIARKDIKLVEHIYVGLTIFITVNLYICCFRNTLIYAIRCGSKDLAVLLLEKGIDFFYKDIFGWTALRYAIEGHCAL